MVLLIILVLGCENTSAKNQSVNKNSVVKQKQKNNNQRKEIISAPDFTLSDLEGNPISLNKLKGKVVLLNFWGTWCGPCRKEIPDFIKLAEKYKDNGLEIIGITLTSGKFIDESMFAFSKSAGEKHGWGVGTINHMTVEQNKQWAEKVYEQFTG